MIIKRKLQQLYNIPLCPSCLPLLLRDYCSLQQCLPKGLCACILSFCVSQSCGFMHTELPWIFSSHTELRVGAAGACACAPSCQLWVGQEPPAKGEGGDLRVVMLWIASVRFVWTCQEFLLIAYKLIYFAQGKSLTAVCCINYPEKWANDEMKTDTIISISQDQRRLWRIPRKPHRDG